MAYNAGFPMGYQQPYIPQYIPQQMPQAQPQQNGIIWVSGEAGAKSYQIAPNTTVQLWDSEAQVIYLKSADNSGMPSMKIIDYTIRDTSQPQSALMRQPEYVTHEELSAFEDKIRKMLKEEQKDESAF